MGMVSSFLYLGLALIRIGFALQVLCAVANNTEPGRASGHGAASFSMERGFCGTAALRILMEV